MRGSTRYLVLFLVLGVPLGVTPPANAKEVNPVIQLAAKLNQVVDFNGFDDPKLTLQEALEFVAKSYVLTIDVNEQTFKAEGLNDVLGQPVAEKPLPLMKGARLYHVLEKILSRIATPSGATFVLRREGIEITTNKAKLAEFYRDGPPTEKESKEPSRPLRPVLPLIQADFEKKPLDEALKELAAMSGYNIVVDGRGSDKAKIEVTATLINVPLDTAVRMLADMADLKPVLLDKVLYVTSKENAAKLQAERDQDKARLDTSNVFPAGGLPPGQ
jgi:hypothetical protein